MYLQYIGDKDDQYAKSDYKREDSNPDSAVTLCVVRFIEYTLNPSNQKELRSITSLLCLRSSIKQLIDKATFRDLVPLFNNLLAHSLIHVGFWNLSGVDLILIEICFHPALLVL